MRKELALLHGRSHQNIPTSCPAGGGFCQRGDGLVISVQFHHGSRGHSYPEIVSFILIDNVPENDIPRICHALGMPNDFHTNVTYKSLDGTTIMAQYRQKTGPVPKLLFVLDNVSAQAEGQLHRALGLPMYPEWELLSKERFRHYFPWFPSL